MKQISISLLKAIFIIAPLLLAAQDEPATKADPYKGGTKYPPSAKVSIQPITVPIGATEVHVPVSLDRVNKTSHYNGKYQKCKQFHTFGNGTGND